ncbi:MAG: ATP-binding cassette domain-containing protein [Planctomycetota bacterium]
MSIKAISLEDVDKSFGSVRAVEGLSVRVPEGSIYGFLGPNGAGKTTTLRMIMDIIRPDRGRIEVLGCRSTAAAKDRIGYMPEERGLYRKMTVGRVLNYFAAIKGVNSKKISTVVPEWLERVELDGWAGKKVEELSRGMHQKLQFAVTAVSNPALLILDEPFSGLDPVNLDLLKGIILDMQKRGKTIVFSTHVMHEAEKLCDYILLINKGKVVVDGTLEQIRSGWPSNTVSAELRGEADFVERLEMVSHVSCAAGRMEITLAEGADPQELLRALADRVRVQSFEVKAPSLHEIFVKLVGKNDG